MMEILGCLTNNFSWSTVITSSKIAIRISAKFNIGKSLCNGLYSFFLGVSNNSDNSQHSSHSQWAPEIHERSSKKSFQNLVCISTRKERSIQIYNHNPFY